jgi:hypothetical protein
MTRMWLTILAASLTVGFCIMAIELMREMIGFCIMAIELFFRRLARFCRRRSDD